MAAARKALQRGRANLGTVNGGRQLRPHLASSGMLASHQRASAPARSTVAPSRFSITSIKTPSADAQVIIRLCHRHRTPGQAETPDGPAIRDLNCGTEPILYVWMTK